MIVADQADEVIRADSGLTDGAVPSEPCLGLHASLNPEEVLEFAVLPNELARFSEYLWGNPSPVLDVAIGELPTLGRDTEQGIEDAIPMDTNEEEELRWRWIVDIGDLGEARDEDDRLVEIRRAIDGLAHVVASRPPKMQGFSFRRLHPRLVGRTPIDVG